MNPAILRIKEAAPLPIIAGEYVKLRKLGSSWQGLCPFHKEKTPSFRVHKDFFKCFGCGAGGDVISFVARIQAVSVGRAIALLSERTGIPLDPLAKPVSRRQRAYDAEEFAFAEWWRQRQCERLAVRLSAYVRMGSEEEADAAGLLWRQFHGAPRSQWRALAERLATAEDRREWDFWQAWPRRMAALMDSIQAASVSFLGAA